MKHLFFKPSSWLGRLTGLLLLAAVAGCDSTDAGDEPPVAASVYVAANSGERVVAYDAATLQRVGQFDAVTSPRYLAAAGPDKLYVTSFYEENFTGGKVTVLDLTTGTKGAEIAVGDNPEGIAVAGTRAYVANHGFGAGRTVTVLDTQADAVVETLDVDCDGPRFVAVDAQEEVWVFCTGNTLYDDDFNVIGETPGAVRVLDGATGQIRARFDLDGRIGTEGPGQDAFYAPGAEEAYAVEDGETILRFDTAANRLAATLGPLAGDPIGAVAYDDGSGRLYVGRVAGFTDAGAVTLHDREGALQGSFPAGIAPTFITFLQEVR
jgi:DNA-binding beta-propeller fold protein YncE